MDPMFLPNQVLSPDLIALGPVVFAVVAFVRKLTAKQDGTYRIDGLVAVSVLSLLVSIGVIFWAFPAASLTDLVRRVPALFLIAVGGTQGLKRIFGNEEAPISPPPPSVLPPAPVTPPAPSPSKSGTPANLYPLEPPPDASGSPAPTANGEPS